MQEPENILEHARGIIYDRSEEKERQYGDFFQNMEDAASIASIMSKKEITAEDVYHCLIGLKLARESHAHKYDNLLDAIAYMASLHEYKESKFERITDSIIKDIEVKEGIYVSEETDPNYGVWVNPMDVFHYEQVFPKKKKRVDAKI